MDFFLCAWVTGVSGSFAHLTGLVIESYTEICSSEQIREGVSVIVLFFRNFLLYEWVPGVSVSFANLTVCVIETYAEICSSEQIHEVRECE